MYADIEIWTEVRRPVLTDDYVRREHDVKGAGWNLLHLGMAVDELFVAGDERECRGRELRCTLLASLRKRVEQGSVLRSHAQWHRWLSRLWQRL